MILQKFGENALVGKQITLSSSKQRKKTLSYASRNVHDILICGKCFEIKVQGRSKLVKGGLAKVSDGACASM